jgi:hypothetical protein
MKKINFSKVMMILGLLVLMLALNTQAQDIRTFSNNWGPHGLSLTRQSFSGVEVNFSVNKLYLEDVNVDGAVLKTAKIEGVFLPNQAGKPDLAGTGRFIAIPQGSIASYRIVSYKTEVIKNVDIAPAPVMPLDNDPSPLKYHKDMSVYSRNANYPESPVILSSQTKIRGVDAVILGITPFQYNPVTKELTVYTDLKVEVNFSGGNGHFGEDAYRSRWWEPILEDAFMNYSSLPKIDFDHRYKDIMLETGYEYVIIRPNNSEFAPWADTLKNFRIQQGIKTGIYTVTEVGGNTVAAIKAWVTNAYNNWTVKPAAICLMGDYNTEASGNTGIISILQTHPDGYPAFASDNYYADVNSDEMPEIVFSRIIGNNTDQLQTLISKNLNYERNPPTSADFYNKPITALGWQTERWFQLCSEIVGGYFKKVQGKLPVRINKVYSGTPSTQWSTATNTATVVNYFGTVGNLKYIPMTPDSLGGFDGGTPQMVVNAINAGSFLLQHRDHGEYIGWGEPGFNTSYITQLTNVGTNLPFVYSINCETGAYHNPSGCPAEGSFVETFVRYKYSGQNSGALGMVCPSEVSYSFVNDTYLWGNYDNMWPDFMPAYGTTPASRDVKPAFGMAAGKYFLQQSSWPYNTGDKQVTYRLFHMFGDAFLNLYSQVPQTLTVSHAATVIGGATQFAVTANSGALIALSLNGNVLGTGTGTGSSLNITIPGTQLPGQVMQVVVTKQNYYRYTANVNVIPASGPYVVQDSIAINDPTPGGNNNHLMDYGETNQLTLRAKNVGSASASNVSLKLRTTSPYITITDSTETYGTIGAGSTVLVNNAFAYTVSNNLPDNTSINFDVVATDGTNTWNSSFSITGHAAIIRMGSNIIVDSTGNNNGRLDPGESVKFKIAIRNSGTSAGRNVSAKLTTTSPYITMTTDSVVYGSVPALDSVRNNFLLSVNSNTPSGTGIVFLMKMYNLSGALVSTDTIRATVGQILISIGTGTSTEAYPIDRFYNYMRWQAIYTRSEIGTTGNIVKIKFYQSNAMAGVTSGPTTIYMKMVSDATLATGNWDVTGHTQVYTGTINNLDAPGWLEITLSTPFLFNMSANQNLLISINRDYQAYLTTYPLFNYTTTSSTLSRRNRSDTAIPTSLTASTYRANIQIEMNTVNAINDPLAGIPKKYDLKQNYPNPFNPVTKINFEIPKQGYVSLKIYDVLGREVKTLVNEIKTAGYYSVDFDASTLSSGVYFYKLESGTYSDIKRMMLIK